MRMILSQAAQLLAEYCEYGLCATDPRVISQINLAIERLITRLNPEKTIVRYQLDVCQQMITMPRDVKTVLAASTMYPSCAGNLPPSDSTSPNWPYQANCYTGSGCSTCGPGCVSILSVKSRWYEMLPGGPVGFVPCAQNILMDLGTGFSTFADPTPQTPLTLRLYADVPQVDSEGFVVIAGTDSAGNNPVSYENNVYVPGQTLDIPTQGVPYNDTPQMWQAIVSITKPLTQGRLRLFGVDANGNQTPLALWEPDELNPDYRRYMVTFVGNPPPSFLTVLAKRRYVYTTSPYADLMITNIGALQNALMAMKYEKAGAYDQATAAWRTAYDILDTETRDFDGDYTGVPQLQTQFAGGDIWSLR